MNDIIRNDYTFTRIKLIVIMDYEKLHKDTIAKLQEMVNSGKITVKTAREICADFIEDERIIKALISILKSYFEKNTIICGISVSDIIAWLEKQGKQKPADKVEPKFKVGDTIKDPYGDLYHITEITDDSYKTDDGRFVLFVNQEVYTLSNFTAWSEEDDAKLKSILFHIEDVENKDVINWLKSLEYRVQPQPKQEWSKEDAEMLNSIVARLHSHPNVDLEEYSEEYKWLNYTLKSLRPQNTWKPSKEQIKTFEYYIDADICNKDKEILFGLYAGLKKLMEE